MHDELNLSKNIRTVIDYHERTKHHPDRFAASLGYMDWANQPGPFRTYADSESIDLPLPALRQAPLYDDLFSQTIKAGSIDADFIGRLFYHSLALSAWKKAPNTPPWSLRINPSSGDLHPTEGYMVSGKIPELIDSPGVFHYAPYNHGLECRCRLSAKQWRLLTANLPAPCLLIGLTSIYWRESWKYGERAFRYCHHDVGHAIGAIAFSARTLGWETRMLDSVPDEELDRLLGTHLQTGIEAEHPDCLLVLFPAGSDEETSPRSGLSSGQWRSRIPDAEFIGQPNRLSRHHHQWPVIADVSRATRKSIDPGTDSESFSLSAAIPMPGLIFDRQRPAEQIIRQRRSAVAMDGRTYIERDVFYHMLQRVMPGQFPFGTFPWPPYVSLAIFVHRVVDLAPGLYLSARTAEHETALRQMLRSDFQWQRAEGCPHELRLYHLVAEDMRRVAKMISCHQDIAADGAFSLGMLAAFDTMVAASNPWRYPRLFWECGLIGQLLYLEAEAAGVRATGIGCFFDDVMHDLLGIAGRGWQSLYHFTVGGPLDDNRLGTIPPYAHLERSTNS